ncbi:hypothetical protein M011DRAFT_398494 [Sporormia fimetaria CBS 119925]|uniref:Uncharacterized protein n=1 Tax=Sporormia fimetaria CBS 119925 TaxID=1340428 RepID=A0A6A6VHE6_9PLEO|nr:hypothetical protein M011DRAFT_398494 [Sporormia fimetaria CBS 119925]
MADQTQASAEQLAQQVCAGFAALTGEYQLLFEQQKQLESKLSFAKQQYLDLLKRFTPSTLSQDHRFFLQELDGVGSEQSGPQTPWLDKLGQSEDAQRRERAAEIKAAETAVEKINASKNPHEVKIWSGPSADKETLPSSTRSGPNSQIEKDFTTLGTPSKLGCPFAAGSRKPSPLATPRSSVSRVSLRGRRSKRPSFTDPIRAEICPNDMASATESVEGSAAVCPIRFLNEHAPEEVAKYFENHKHEIPRSHEVCIKRFQSNTESIQQLDRKYGDLVSMIQGLGQKHQEFLPAEPDEDEIEETEHRKENRVHSWAEEVSASLQNQPTGEEAVEDGGDESRTSHFDRPLKEVRVGESPSRPWGIHVPAKYTDDTSSSSVGSAPTASPPPALQTRPDIGASPPKVSKCPFGHGAPKPTVENNGNHDVNNSALPAGPQSRGPPEAMPQARPQATSQAQPPNAETKSHFPSPPQSVPQMVFNGPVFLGYPPDQLMAILQSGAFGAVPR